MAISNKLNPILNNLPFKNLFYVSMIFSLITFVSGILAQLILPPEIPLFYGLPQTNSQITQSIMITIPSIISIIICIINIIIAVKTVDNYNKRILAFASVFISILATVSTFKIIFLVGSI